MKNTINHQTMIATNSSKRTIAVILSAGIGSRLRPLTETLPKALIEVTDVPILFRQLSALKESGIAKVIIVTGYLSDIIKDRLERSEFKNYADIVENKAYSSTNNIYSAYLAFRYIESQVNLEFDNIILANGDVIFDKSIILTLLQSSKDQIAVEFGAYYEESMKVSVDFNGNIRKISKTIQPNEALGVSIDVYFFEKQTWTSFGKLVIQMVTKECLSNVWTEHGLQRFITSSAIEFTPLNVKGLYWFEIDTFNDLLEAERRLTLQKTYNLMNKQLFIFDLDGTTLLGDAVLPGVLDFLRLLQRDKKTVAFLTNNSSLSTEEHLKRLQTIFQLNLTCDNLYTSLNETKEYLKKSGVNKLFLLAVPSVKEEFLLAGFILDSDNPDGVLITFDKSLTYDKLQKACTILNTKKEVNLILSNGDLKCPTENGFIPDAGGIGKLVELTTGRKINSIRGKPNIEMITNLISRHSLTKEDCVFFGDRLYTDVVMGEQSTVETVLMLTGETTIKDLDRPFLRNHFVFLDFCELLQYFT